MLLAMGLQRVGHKLVTEQEQQYKQCLWLEMNISGHRLFYFLQKHYKYSFAIFQATLTL